MIKHIVLFRLKASAEGATKEQNALRIQAELEALKTVIPQIGHLEVGINCIPGDAAYDVAVYAEFANEQDVHAYLTHPEHVKVAAFVGKVREDRAVVDYRKD